MSQYYDTCEEEYDCDITWYEEGMWLCGSCEDYYSPEDYANFRSFSMHTQVPRG